MAEFTL